MSITTEQAAAWFADRAKTTPMPGAREMFEIAAAAIREKAERENPKPLTLVELMQMHDEPVWFEVLDIKDPETPCESVWTQVWVWDTSISFFSFGNECDIMPKAENYGKTWVCYRHKPKGVEKNAND